jgi:hypothetical protein
MANTDDQESHNIPVRRSGDGSAEPKAPVPASEPPQPTDAEADVAVDDIMKHDGDEALKKQDEVAAKAFVMKLHWWEKIRDFNTAWWGNPRKRWGTIVCAVLVLGASLGVPYIRYNALGLVMKAPVTVQVVDSKNGEPVSGATVMLAGQKAQTDGEGKAVLKVKAGSKTLTVSKSYYKGFTHGELVALGGNRYKATVEALGRQVKVKVVNKITGKPVAGVAISAGSASAKTDKNGLATLVTPSSADKQDATVSGSGYNTLKVTVMASGGVTKNTFSVVPAGKIYFLSNLTGRLDVVKTNLDGSDRSVVLEGTGSEDRQNTSLLASRDWKYLALLSKRSGDNASVYLIDTTQNDKLITIDQGNADFSLVGWSGDRFIYQVSRNTVSDWQPNQQALKSLDATTGQTLLLDQTQGSGTNQGDFVKQVFGSPYIIGDQVVYAKNWSANYSVAAQLNGKQAELDTIGAGGSGHKTLKTFAPASGDTTYISIDARLYEPNAFYIAFNNGGQYDYYTYEDGKVSADTSLTEDKYFNTPYPTYLLSPSANSTFWTEQRDGKNTLFVGNADAKNSKQVASLSPYNTYGWYADDYLLVSKGSSELYIMPAAGGAPQKITDYYKPAVNYNGYGGGYGGL